MSISENLIELNKIKNNIKTTVNNYGGHCADDFTKYGLAIEKVILEGFASIGEGRSLNISEGVEVIKNFAFLGNTVISSITIPNTVIEIGNKSFSEMTLLTELVIPDSVSYIGDEAFKNSSYLSSVTLPSDADYMQP